jgi:hypothetical protein
LALLVPAVLLALNRQFYALLLRRGGPSMLVAGVVLHILHHLTAVAAVPLGIGQHLRSSDEPPRAQVPVESG